MSLYPYCKSDNEKRVIEIHEANPDMSYSAIERELGDINRTTVSRILGRVASRAALQGHSPTHDMTHTTPDTHVVKGTSTLYDAHGNISQQWVKTNLKLDAQIEALSAVVESMKEDVVPVAPIPDFTRNLDSDLLSMVTFSDHHLGMLSWGEETGSDWDLDKAERILVECFAAMMDGSPNAETCIINNLGDFLHYDGWASITPSHGHILDTDTRFPKLVRSAIRVIRQVINMALERHKYVHIKMIEGNHDMASSVWLRELFDTLYDLEPRVTVDTSASPYQIYQFGDVLLGFHHGHCKKSSQLPLLFATEFSTIWGQTQYRYVHVGHRHHQDIKEYTGMYVEQHSTLASRDAYASRGGYSSNRRASCITYHREYGEVARNYVTPEMLGYQ